MTTTMTNTNINTNSSKDFKTRLFGENWKSIKKERQRQRNIIIQSKNISSNSFLDNYHYISSLSSSSSSSSSSTTTTTTKIIKEKDRVDEEKDQDEIEIEIEIGVNKKDRVHNNNNNNNNNNKGEEKEKEKEKEEEEKIKMRVDIEAKKIEKKMRDEKIVRVVAPMVRYSKLPFRMLCRKWNCDLTYTPMIMANSFIRSKKARDSDFLTCSNDRPLIVQFASNNSMDFARAAQIVQPYCDGIDLNCGCPQRWAIDEKLGAHLINEPELVRDMVLQMKQTMQGYEDFQVSIKIRIHKDIRQTVDLVRQMEKAGVSFMAVHGRTLQERTKVPVHLDHIATIVENVDIPILANGDVYQPKDIFNCIQATNAQGVMCARGILSNPALFAGYSYPPKQCIQDYLDEALQWGGHYKIHHHHLMFMLSSHYLTKSEKLDFNSRKSMCSILDFLKQRHIYTPSFSHTTPLSSLI